MNARAEVVVTQELSQRSTDALTAATEFAIATPAAYEEAALRLKLNKALQAEIDAHFGPHIKRAFDAHRALVADKNKALAPLTQAETVYKAKMIGYQNESDRIRREAEAKAREAAEKERQKLEARAAKQSEKGNESKAEALRDQAALVPTAVVNVETPKVAGITTRETWTFEITDANLIPREYLVPDESRIRGVVRAMKSATNIPGIRAFADKGISSRSA